MRLDAVAYVLRSAPVQVIVPIQFANSMFHTTISKTLIDPLTRFARRGWPCDSGELLSRAKDPPFDSSKGQFKRYCEFLVTESFDEPQHDQISFGRVESCQQLLHVHRRQNFSLSDQAGGVPLLERFELDLFEGRPAPIADHFVSRHGKQPAVET